MVKSRPNQKAASCLGCSFLILELSFAGDRKTTSILESTYYTIGLAGDLLGDLEAQIYH